MASMVGAISLRLGFNHWWFTVPAIFFSSLGFVIGAVLAEQKLNFELKA
jgi:hypothetical protein